LRTHDLLYVDDLVEALLLARARIRTLSGRAFNIGGGPKNQASLIELLRLIGEMRRDPPFVRFTAPKRVDQRYYTSDTTRFRKATGWEPGTRVEEGIRKLHEYLMEPALLAVRQGVA
jgi:CDP-paratose 2-epimerase